MVLPMRPERVGKEVADEEEPPERIDSVKQALETFKPELKFQTFVGEKKTEFVVEVKPRTLRDFEPDNILKRVPGQRNDLASLETGIKLLSGLKECWSLPTVKRAWDDPGQRKQIIAILNGLREKIDQLTSPSQATTSNPQQTPATPKDGKSSNG